jgi:putative PIN family toxin of toxin-antitoxin system
VRAVLDPNVLISAVISSAGAPRDIILAWTEGSFDLVISPLLLDELREVLARPRFRRWVSASTVAEFIGLARRCHGHRSPAFATV